MTVATQEVWKPVKNYEGLYEVSNFGRVRSLSSTRTSKYRTNIYRLKDEGLNIAQIAKFLNCRVGTVKHLLKRREVSRYLTTFDDGRGYLRVTLCKKRIRQHVGVHRLVAEAFIPNLENKPHVNHKDSNRSNARADNLEWCTPLENSIHALKSSTGHRKWEGCICWDNYHSTWIASIMKDGKVYTKSCKSSRKVVENWLEGKVEEFNSAEAEKEENDDTRS